MTTQPSSPDTRHAVAERSFGTEIEELRRWLAQQRSNRPHRVAFFDRSAKAASARPSSQDDRPLLISGTPLR